MRQAHGPLGPFMANLAWCTGRVIAQIRRLAGKPVPPAHDAEGRDIWIGFAAPLAPAPETRS